MVVKIDIYVYIRFTTDHHILQIMAIAMLNDLLILQIEAIMTSTIDCILV